MLWRGRMWIGALAVVGCLGGLTWRTWSEMAEFRLVQVAPAELDLWVEVNMMPLIRHQVWSAIVDKVTDRGRLNDRWMEAMQRFLDEQRIEVSIAEDIMPWAGRQMGLGVFDLAADHGPPGWLLIMEVKAPERAAEAMPKLARAIWGERREISQNTFEGQQYVFVAREGGEEEATLCLAGAGEGGEKYLMVANRRSMISKCLRRLHGGGESFAATEAYRELEQVSGEGVFLRGAMSRRWMEQGLQRWRDRLLKGYDQEREWVQDDLELNRLLQDELVVPGRTIYAVVSAVKEGLRAEAGVTLAAEAAEESLLRRLAGLRLAEGEATVRAPQSALGAARLPSVRQLYELFMATVEKYERLSKDVHEGMEEIGVDFETLTSRMSGEAELIWTGIGGYYGEMPQLALVVEGADEATVRGKLPEARRLLRLLGGGEPKKAEREFYRQSFGGREYEIMPTEAAVHRLWLLPCVAVEGNRMILSLTPQAMEACLAGGEEPAGPGGEGAVAEVVGDTNRLMNDLLIEAELGRYDRDPLELWVFNAVRVPEQVRGRLLADEGSVRLEVEVPADYELVERVAFDLCDILGGSPQSGYPRLYPEREEVEEEMPPETGAPGEEPMGEPPEVGAPEMPARGEAYLMIYPRCPGVVERVFVNGHYKGGAYTPIPITSAIAVPKPYRVRIEWEGGEVTRRTLEIAKGDDLALYLSPPSP